MQIHVTLNRRSQQGLNVAASVGCLSVWWRFIRTPAGSGQAAQEARPYHTPLGGLASKPFFLVARSDSHGYDETGASMVRRPVATQAWKSPWPVTVFGLLGSPISHRGDRGGV